MAICDAPTSVLHYLQQKWMIWAIIWLPIWIDEMMICKESISFFRSFDLHCNSREEFVDSLISYIDNWKYDKQVIDICQKAWTKS
jgi:hypothetical protein